MPLGPRVLGLFVTEVAVSTFLNQKDTVYSGMGMFLLNTCYIERWEGK